MKKSDDDNLEKESKKYKMINAFISQDTFKILEYILKTEGFENRSTLLRCIMTEYLDYLTALKKKNDLFINTVIDI